MMRRLYEPLYRIIRIFRVPIEWVFGSHPELAELVESGRIAPGRAIDLGCGVGNEAIYLASNGFDVTGVDFSSTAIRIARDKADAASVEVTFIEDDLTNLRHIGGTFDLVVDYGALNDLTQQERDLYMSNVLPLTRPGSRFLLMCFEKKLPSDEVEQRFGETFNIEIIAKKSEDVLPRYIVFYLMTRK
jgi:cyclopropane fatty-acyl-phospholipid synthase-like methyltransferase